MKTAHLAATGCQGHGAARFLGLSPRGHPSKPPRAGR